MMTLAQTMARASEQEIELPCGDVVIGFRLRRIDSALLKAKGVNALLAASTPEMRAEAQRMVANGEITAAQGGAFLQEAVSPDEYLRWTEAATRFVYGCVAAGVVAWRARATDAEAWPEWESVTFTLHAHLRDPDAGVLLLPQDLPAPVVAALNTRIEALTNGGLAGIALPTFPGA